jgi:hypothetical protein
MLERFSSQVQHNNTDFLQDQSTCKANLDQREMYSNPSEKWDIVGCAGGTQLFVSGFAFVANKCQFVCVGQTPGLCVCLSVCVSVCVPHNTKLDTFVVVNPYVA